MSIGDADKAVIAERGRVAVETENQRLRKALAHALNCTHYIGSGYPVLQCDECNKGETLLSTSASQLREEK